MDQAKSLVISSGTLGLGVGVVACQVGLYVGAATTNLFLDGAIATKNLGCAIVSKGIGTAHTVEERVTTLIMAVQCYANELRKKLESGAFEAVTNPRVVLAVIKASAIKLNDQLERLRLSGSQLLGDPVISHVCCAIDYVKEFDQNLTKAQDISQVHEQVFEEAKQKFQEIAQWSAGLLNKANKVKSKQNGTQ